MDKLAVTNFSPKESEPFLPSLSSSSSEDEEEPSGSGDHQEPEAHPAPRTSTQTPGRNRSAPANQQDATADPNTSRAAEVRARSLQKRVIHLLALEPYRMKHFVQRLQRDGLTNQQRQALKSVLVEIAVLMKNGLIALKDKCFNDVEANWPGYFIEERHLLRRILLRKLYQDSCKQEKCQKPITADPPNLPKPESPVCTVYKKPRVSHIFKGLGRSQHTLPLNPRSSSKRLSAAVGVNPAAADEPELQGAQAAAVQPQADSARLNTHSDGHKDDTGD